MTIFAVTYRYSDDAANDRAHVDALVGKDPFTTSGVIAAATTAEWEPVIGAVRAPAGSWFSVNSRPVTVSVSRGPQGAGGPTRPDRERT